MPFTNSKKWGCWEPSQSVPEDSIATKVSLIEVPMTKVEMEEIVGPLVRGTAAMLTVGLSELIVLGGHEYNHDALEFDVVSVSGVRTTMTAHFTKKGVRIEWGKFENRTEKQTAEISLPLSWIREIVSTEKSYHLVNYNCKHFSNEMIEAVTGLDPRNTIEVKKKGVYASQGSQFGSQIEFTTGETRKTIGLGNGQLGTATSGPGLQAGLIQDKDRIFAAECNPVLVRQDVSYRGVNAGVGLNANTGVSVRKNGGSLKALGFGISWGNGAGISCPIADLSFGPKRK